jgi:PKD repeat protein
MHWRSNITYSFDNVPTTSPSSAVTPTTAAASPTPVIATPTIAAANAAPTCFAFASSVASGSAPLAVNFTASGRDTDGTLSKATFNFGDGSQQDVSTGLGTASGSAQTSHTYANGGTFKPTAVFTDNRGALSALNCTLTINVSGAFATIPPTAPPTATIGPIATDIPTNTPTIAPSGSITNTLGIAGGILLVIVAGIFLLAL